MEDLARVTRRLTDRLAGVSVGWYGARLASGHGTRGSRLRELVVELADLGRTAGTGAPEGVVPGSVGVHAFADQVTVLAADLAAAPGAGGVLESAVAAVSACAADLWVT